MLQVVRGNRARPCYTSESFGHFLERTRLTSTAAARRGTFFRRWTNNPSVVSKRYPSSLNSARACWSISVASQTAHTKKRPRVCFRANLIDFSRIDSVGDPFFFAVVARILSRRVTHDPDVFNSLVVVRMREASSKAETAHEHFDRGFNLIRFVRHELGACRGS